jgi:hypothetical protein
MHEGHTQPSRYRVVVKGHVGERLAETFEHLVLEQGNGESSLTGAFADQAQLHGLLDRLQDLGISLVSVNPADDRPATTPHRPPATLAGRHTERTAAEAACTKGETT